MYIKDPNLSTKNQLLAKFLTPNEHSSIMNRYFKTIFLTNDFIQNIMQLVIINKKFLKEYHYG